MHKSWITGYGGLLMDKEKKPGMSLKRRITLQFAVLMIIITIVVNYVGYSSLKNTYFRLYNEKARDVVAMLASQVDGDKIRAYVETGETDEYYYELVKEFNRVKSSITGIEYLYLFCPEKDYFTYVLDSYEEGDDPDNINKLGDVFNYGEMEKTHLVPDVEAGRASTDIIRGEDVGYGQTISAWAPVFDSEGKVAGMVEADCILSDLNTIVRNYAIKTIGILVICLIGFLVAMIWVLRRNVTEPIGQLTEMVNSYDHKSIEPKKFRCDDEIQWLGDSFVDMTRRIEEYTSEVARVTAEKERIGAELNVATQIQSDMLPSIFPPFPNKKEFELYALMDPAKEVGGDFYDFFLVDDNHIALVMADVCGKGVPAALFMVIAKTLIKNSTLTGISPAQVLSSVNEQLCEGNEAEFFVTVWLAIVELSTGKGIAANAGHEHPVLRRAGGNYELVEYRHSPAVATMSGILFKEHTFELNPGDSLFVYTDGVPEATDSADEMYGSGRMVEALNRVPDAQPEELIKCLRADMAEFTGDAQQFDDITMLSFRYNGPDKNTVTNTDENTDMCEDELTLDAKTENLERVLDFVGSRLDKTDCSEKLKVQINIAVEELFVNIAHYAYKQLQTIGSATVRVEVEKDPLAVSITFIDSGHPYNPLEKPDPDVTLPAEKRQIGGLGIFMVKKSMDAIEYEYKDGRNILKIKKNLN